MAESKNKSTAKKKATPKKSASAKTSSGKSATKKAPAVAASKKSSNVKAQPKKVEKKVEKAAPNKHVSSTVKESGKSWMVAAIVLAVLIVLLIAVIGFFALGGKDNSNNENLSDNTNTDLNTNTDSNAVSLLIVEDPSCINCQVDFFAEQVKANLINDLVVAKVSYDSADGAKIVSELNMNQVPVYLFSKNIDERADWEEELSGAFIPVTIDTISYYLLNPQFIPNKVMIQDVEITDNAIVIGDANAPVTIVEFTDYECPFCAIAEGNSELVLQFSGQNPGYVPPMPSVYENYVDEGLVKIVFYNYPIASLHPNARVVHNAGLCANEQNMFKEYSSNLWDKRSEWSSATVDRVDTLKKYASELGLDTTMFNECLDTKKYDSQITEELALGQSYGVSGTPAFFVGRTFISGAQDYLVFEDLIEAELAKIQN